ncbi:MAG: hypothetical protein Q9170_003712 [Blastenia crenularia]
MNLPTTGNTEALPILDELPPTQVIDEGIDDEGGLKFCSNWLLKGPQGTWWKPDDNFIVALALTEACCKFGKGKVYWVPMAYGYAPEFNVVDTAFLFAHSQAPKLLYEPCRWGEDEKSDWENMSHSDRLAHCNGWIGLIPGLMPVMPIELTYNTVERANIRFKARNNEEAGATANLIIAPKAYLGWSNQLKEGAQLVGATSSSLVSPQWWEGDSDHLESNHRRKDSLDVVRGLWDMYFEEEASSNNFVKEIFAYMKDFPRQWESLGGRPETLF